MTAERRIKRGTVRLDSGDTEAGHRIKISAAKRPDHDRHLIACPASLSAHHFHTMHGLKHASRIEGHEIVTRIALPREIEVPTFAIGYTEGSRLGCEALAGLARVHVPLEDHANGVKRALFYDGVLLHEPRIALDEYRDGNTARLDAFLDKYGPNGMLDAVKLYEKVVKRLSEKKVIHSDLMPRNILMKREKDGIHIAVIDWAGTKSGPNIDQTFYDYTQPIKNALKDAKEIQRIGETRPGIKQPLRVRLKYLIRGLFE